MLSLAAKFLSAEKKKERKRERERVGDLLEV